MKTLRFPMAALMLAVAMPAAAQAPDAVWQHYAPGGAYYAVASDAKRVYAVGRADSPATGGHDFLVDAFDPETGATIWHTQWDDPGWKNDESAGMWSAEVYTAPHQLRNDLIQVSGGRLYIGGASCGANAPCDIDRPTYDPNHFAVSTLLALNATTGTVLWRRQAGVGGGILAMTTGGGRIFTADGMFIQAWDQDGTLLWLEYVDGSPSALDYDGGKLFVSYDGGWDPAPNAVAYDPSTGTKLWTQPGVSHDQVDAIASGGGRLVTAGRHEGVDGTPYVRLQSLSEATGTVQWTAPLIADRDVAHGEAIDVAINASRVFAAGIRTTGTVADGTGFFVRAHSLTSGALLWKDEPDLGPYASAYAVSYLTGLNRAHADGPISRLGSSLVVVAGFGTDDVGDGFGVLRAYEPKTGQLVWQHTFGTVDRRDEFLALAKSGRHVVTVGTATPNLSWKWGKTPQAGYPESAEAIVAAFE